MEATPPPRASASSPAARLLRVRQILQEAGHAPIAQADEPREGTPSATPRVTPGAGAPARDADPEPEPLAASQATRLALTALAGARRRVGDRVVPTTWTRWRTWLVSAPADGQPSRLELGALGAALIGAAAIGTTIPGSAAVQAQGAAGTPLALAAAPAAAAPAAATSAGDATDTSTGAAASAPTGDATTAAAATSDPATTAATSAPAAAPVEESATEEPAGDGTDPLAGGGTTLSRVALIVVQGDSPAAWPAAAPETPARRRAARGTTYTGLAVLPGAPLATSLALTTGQPANPATRAGCQTATPVTPGTTGADGLTAGTGCDFPATTPSLPGAIARDGRRWRAYAAASSAAEAAAALCRPYDAAATDEQRASAQRSALGHLADLTESGACEAAATPLDALAADLSGDDPPAWLSIQISPCGNDGCDPAESARRDAALDAALTTLASAAPADGGRTATFIVGDGDGAGLLPAPAGSYPTNPSDPEAPGAVLAGALLIGDGVTADRTDPIALDPYAIARTQAQWLGVAAPGLAAGAGVTALALPE